MWIERVDVRGFKRLRGEWELAQGLTLVTGPNEAGKSSFHELLLRILFGFSAKERRRSGGVSVKNLCAPWDGAPFAANAVVHDPTRDRTLAIEWDFAEHRVTVRDANTGEDLSAQVRGARDEVHLGRFLLGLSLDEFREVCWLHQRAIDPVRPAEPLSLSLRRAVESGSADTGVEEADARLTAYLRERLGVHAGHYRELQGRALFEARRQQEELAAELECCEEGRQSIVLLAHECSEKEQQREAAASARERVRQQLLLSELGELNRRLERVRQHREVAASAPRNPVVVSTADRDQVIRLQQLAAHLEGEVAELERRVTAGAEELAEKRHRRDELARETDALSSYAEVDVRQRDTVRRVVAELEAASHTQDPPPPPPELDPRLRRFRDKRDRLERLAEQAETTSWNRGRLALAALIAVAAVLLAGLVHPLALGGVVVAAVVVLSARVTGSAAASELRDALAELDATSIGELAATLEEADRVRVAAQGQRDEYERAERERQDRQRRLEEELRHALDAAEAPPREPLRERAQGYLVACDKHDELERVQSELSGLDAEIEAASTSAADLETKRRELTAAQDQLAAAYEQLGIHEDDDEQRARAFTELLKRAEQDERRAQDAAAARTALDELLGDSTLEELQRRRDELEQELREHRALYGELAYEEGDRDALRRELSTLDARVQQLDVELGTLETKIEEREADLPSAADIRRELDELEEAIGRMELERDAIRLARETLAAASRSVRQAFAPHLRSALVRNLPRITDGRYTDATIDENLEIQVIAPETGQLVPVSVLSRGTQDQIHLVERFEIARLLDPTTGNAPLLLDDPFARFDDRRLRAGVELLADVATRRQVVLCSDNKELAAVLGEVCPELHVIELPGPPRPAQEDVLDDDRPAASGEGRPTDVLSESRST